MSHARTDTPRPTRLVPLRLSDQSGVGVTWIKSLGIKSLGIKSLGIKSLGIKALVFAAGLLFSAPVLGGETCDYAARTDYSGAATIRAEVSPAKNETVIRVTMRFTARVWLIFNVEYLTEEISRWRNDELRSVALNIRYIVNGSIIRQRWDYFDRDKDGFAAYRVQGKHEDDFRRKYPAFSRYWSPATFGQPWLDAYQSAPPERRPDLDLKNQAIPPGLRPPLAFAFYWIRTLRPIGQTVPIFLPGNKRQSRLDLSLPPPEAEPGQQRLWRVPVRLDAFRISGESRAMAWISPTRQLEQIVFDVSGRKGAGSGLVEKLRCERS